MWGAISDAPRILGPSPSGCTRLFKSIGDALHNGVDLRSDLMIPESQYVVSCIAQKLSSIVVAGQFVRVLRTVDLDNQPRLWAKEIREEWTDRMLAAELESIELAAAQARQRACSRSVCSRLNRRAVSRISAGLDDIVVRLVERSAQQAIAPNGCPSP